MTPELEALARRAVACKGWRWMAGMRVVRPDGTFPLRIVQSGCLAHEGAPEDGWPPRVQVAKGLHLHDLPDLTDPCTLGGLLALVREAQEDRFGAVAYDGRWRWYGKDGEGLPVADDYAVCLVLALEAAP